MGIAPTEYRVKCQECGKVLEDDGLILECPQQHPPALLVSDYSAKRLAPHEGAPGIYRYASWLPIRQSLSNSGRAVTYRSTALASTLGLTNLWIAFSGYWPERGATLETATFKELEAYSVLARLPRIESEGGALILASAGNTAAAFALTCSRNAIPCLIVMPASGLRAMQFAEPLAPCVRLVTIGGGADYSDAIALANRIAQLGGFIPEGGVKNIGRRDGLATAMLSAVEAMKRLPDYYFQAIGSGSGAIAVHEAAKRLVADGRFGDSVPQLMLSQNHPFAPMYDAWRRRRRDLTEMDGAQARAMIQKVIAEVLTNRWPPYSVAGGVYDALCESCGDMLVVDNAEAQSAMRLFHESEGIDIDPAPAVAVASLAKAIESGQTPRDATILLHITGGGRALRAAENHLVAASPTLEINLHDLTSANTVNRVVGLFAHNPVETLDGTIC
ncbi:MAG TPA: cysteate synthase [Ktedonobacterales bacterium]|jgi:cysteate synthase